MPTPPETPWQPDPNYLLHLHNTWIVLLSPAGRYHLALDDEGQWWHLQPRGPQLLDNAGRAAQLRPSDVDLIIKMTMIWAWKSVVGDAAEMNVRVPDAIDALAAGVKQMVVTYAQQAIKARS